MGLDEDDLVESREFTYVDKDTQVSLANPAWNDEPLETHPVVVIAGNYAARIWRKCHTSDTLGDYESPARMLVVRELDRQIAKIEVLTRRCFRPEVSAKNKSEEKLETETNEG